MESEGGAGRWVMSDRRGGGSGEPFEETDGRPVPDRGERPPGASGQREDYGIVKGKNYIPGCSRIFG